MVASLRNRKVNNNNTEEKMKSTYLWPQIRSKGISLTGNSHQAIQQSPKYQTKIHFKTYL